LPKSLWELESRTFFSERECMHGHVALELAGANAHERDAVAMLRVHVRLNLEDEAGERRVLGAISMPPITRGLGRARV
jgi:hypothetical protein